MPQFLAWGLDRDAFGHKTNRLQMRTSTRWQTSKTNSKAIVVVVVIVVAMVAVAMVLMVVMAVASRTATTQAVQCQQRGPHTELRPTMKLNSIAFIAFMGKRWQETS